MLKKLKKYKYTITSPVLFLTFLFIYNEYVIYWQVLSKCHWTMTADQYKAEGGGDDSKLMNVMLLSDTHLLGSRNGHWFDKLRREWQQHRAYQTARTLFRPDLIVIMGDLTDEGKWCSDKEWKYYEERAKELFYVDDDESTQLLIIAGNHDIGFHYEMSKHKIERFNRSFPSKFVQLYQPKSFKNLNFVLLNSMTMEGDLCEFCTQAARELKELNKTLSCLKQFTDEQLLITKSILKQQQESNDDSCNEYRNRPEVTNRNYSRPIVFTHYPLYRLSDRDCPEDLDSEYTIVDDPTKRSSFNRQSYDVLSIKATQIILESTNPRLVFNGHTHYSCMNRAYGFAEYTLSSFSWRNIHIPSFLLLQVDEKSHYVEKCFLPSEKDVIRTYMLSGCTLFLYYFLLILKRLNLLFSHPKKFH